MNLENCDEGWLIPGEPNQRFYERGRLLRWRIQIEHLQTKEPLVQVPLAESGSAVLSRSKLPVYLVLEQEFSHFPPKTVNKFFTKIVLNCVRTSKRERIIQPNIGT